MLSANKEAVPVMETELLSRSEEFGQQVGPSNTRHQPRRAKGLADGKDLIQTFLHVASLQNLVTSSALLMEHSKPLKVKSILC